MQTIVTMSKQIRLEWKYKHNYHLVVGQDSFDRTGETGPVYNKKNGSWILSFLIIAGIGTLIFHFHCFPSPQTFVYFHFRAICLKISFTETGRINFMISIDSIKLLGECLLNIWNGFQCDVKKGENSKVNSFWTFLFTKFRNCLSAI